MEPNRPNGGAPDNRLRLLTRPERQGAPDEMPERRDVVFDFTGLENPDIGDLSLILTARLGAAPTDRVWMRGVPTHTLRIMRGLGLDHLFRQYPRMAESPN